MSEWINVKDRLPEEEGLYLSFINCEDGETTTILYYTKENQFAWMPVTHWMPLPDVPSDNLTWDTADVKTCTHGFVFISSCDFCSPLREPSKEECKHDFGDILLTVIPPKMQCVKCGHITKV